MKRNLSLSSVLGWGILLAASSRVFASTFKVIYTFGAGGSADAALPQGGVIRDGAGNLYGTTVGGGEHGAGTVFELSPSGSNWTEKTLYSFTNGADGELPVAGLVFDSQGNLYGLTQQGGTINSNCSIGCGVVFELSPSGSAWSEKVLHSFTGGAGGATPDDPLLMDAAGNLYGTTFNGGSKSLCFYGCGVVFELVKASGWADKILFTFENPSQGLNPAAGLIFYNNKNLVGTTMNGGSGYGTAFELTPNTNGTWSETILHSFCSKANCGDGSGPQAGLVLRNGRLFGTTVYGGTAGSYCTAYELAPATGGWKLYDFSFAGTDGAVPVAPLLAQSGKLFGVTEQGGIKNHACSLYSNGSGVVYQVVQSGTTLNETVLYEFTGGNDGCGLMGPLVSDAAGNLYGTTFQGGEFGEGVVFEVTP